MVIDIIIFNMEGIKRGSYNSAGWDLQEAFNEKVDLKDEVRKKGGRRTSVRERERERALPEK